MNSLNILDKLSASNAESREIGSLNNLDNQRGKETFLSAAISALEDEQKLKSSEKKLKNSETQNTVDDYLNGIERDIYITAAVAPVLTTIASTILVGAQSILSDALTDASKTVGQKDDQQIF